MTTSIDLAGAAPVAAAAAAELPPPRPTKVQALGHSFAGPFPYQRVYFRREHLELTAPRRVGQDLESKLALRVGELALLDSPNVGVWKGLEAHVTLATISLADVIDVGHLLERTTALWDTLYRHYPIYCSYNPQKSRRNYTHLNLHVGQSEWGGQEMEAILHQLKTEIASSTGSRFGWHQTNLHISVRGHGEGMHFCSDEHAPQEESATLWPLRGRTARSRGTIALDEFPWRRAD